MSIPTPSEGERDAYLRLIWAAKGAGLDVETVRGWAQREPHAYAKGGDDAFDRDWHSDKQPAGGISAGTLFHLARAAGWRDATPLATHPRHADAQSSASIHPDTPQLAEFADLRAYVVPLDFSKPPPPAHAFAFGAADTGMFPLGKVSVLAGAGGTMKTAAAVAACVNTATGRPMAGLHGAPGAALYVSAEDDAQEMTRRVIATALSQTDEGERELVAKRVQIVAMPGQDTRLSARVFGVPESTPLVARVIAQAKAHAEGSGVPVRLIVIDHARLVAGGDVNDSEQVTELMRALSHIAQETGAAVLLLCHSPKSSLNPLRESEFSAADVLGSGAFHDNARFVAVLSALTDGERKQFGLEPDAGRRHLAFRVIKSNYSQGGRTIYMRKTPVLGWGVAVPVPVDLRPPVKTVSPDAAADARVLDYIAQHRGRFSVRTLRATRAGLDGPLRLGEKALDRIVASMLSDGRLILRAPTAEERKEHGIPHQTKDVLDVKVET